MSFKALLLALFTFSVSACKTDCPVIPTPSSGSVQLAWSITVRGQAVTCALVGATFVQLRLRDTNGVEASSTFPCTDTADVGAANVGSYEAQLALLDAGGTALSTSAPQEGVSVSVDQVTTLQAIVFDLPDNRGRLELSFAAIRTARNCLAPPDGVGITGAELFLYTEGTTCVEATLTRTKAGQPNGTYTINCTTPAVAPCFERDEVLSIDGLGSGPYTITVSGFAGARVCWIGEDVLSVPAGGTDRQSIQLGPQQGC